MMTLKKSIQMAKGIAGLVTASIGQIAAILSGGTSTQGRVDDNGDLPGLYNYRTGKFDNGTDPYGWYEEDL